MKKTIAKALAALLATAGLSQAALADSVYCSGKVDKLVLDPSGTVTLYLPQGIPVMCNVNGSVSTSQGSVTSDVCKNWYAMFMTSRSTGQVLTMAFFVPNAAATSCYAQMPNFQLPPNYPYYVYLEG